MGFMTIDVLLFPVKVHYFLFMAALACALPFRTVFSKQLGISATAIGIIFLAIPFFKMLTNPLFGLLVDHFKKFRLTVAVLMIIVAVTHVAMVFLPPLETSRDLSQQAQNLLSTAEYVCPVHDKGHYISVHSEFKTESDGKGPQISCEVICQNDLRPTSEISQDYESCNKSVSGILKVNFRIRDYHFEFSITNESYLVVQNSTRKLENIDDKTLKSWFQPKKLDCSSNQNCFIANRQNFAEGEQDDLNHTRNLKSLELNSDKEVNFVALSEGNDTKSHYKFIAQNIFRIESLDEHSDCFCNEQLNCVTTKCNYVGDLEELNMEKDEFHSFQFWSLFFLTAISSACFSAVMFLVDTMCYEMLSDKKEDYGLQRLWGTVGWGLGALAGGYLNHLISPDSINIDYSLSFYLLGALIILDLVPIYKLQITDVKYSSNICKDVCSLLFKVDILINVLMVFSIGILSGFMWNYQFWFMEEIGASQVLLGLSQTFECIVAELPCFLISGWVIRKIGYANCNNLTFLCFGLRYLCFAYMWDPWLTLPVGLLHGPTFGIFYASMTMYGKTEAPPGTEATVQSLLSMSFEGVGAGAGSILGGIGIDMFGSRNAFLISAIASFVLLAVNILLNIFVLSRRAKEEPSAKSK